MLILLEVNKMGSAAAMHGAESHTILYTLVQHGASGVLSFTAADNRPRFSKHRALKIQLCDLDETCLSIEAFRRKSRPQIALAAGHIVDISLKYGYARYVFKTEVLSIRPSADHPDMLALTLRLPDDVEFVERRDYFRVHIPEIVNVGVILSDHCTLDSRRTLSTRVWKGRLIDISIGGLQVTVPMIDPEHPHPAAGAARKTDLAPAQKLHVKFVPFPYERPLELDTVITTICETADEKFICLGLQIADLNMNAYSRQIQRTLSNAVERYHNLGRSSANLHEMTPVPN